MLGGSWASAVRALIRSPNGRIAAARMPRSWSMNRRTFTSFSVSAQSLALRTASA
jgi:hypothetical protein